ncbi:hypothetical protein KW459_15460 [Vibrio fluvialis]|nr:hypothetical protein [Vibrio fluvialis]
MSDESDQSPYDKTEEILSMDTDTYKKAVDRWKDASNKIIDNFLGARLPTSKLEGIELASGVKMFRIADDEFLFVGRGIEFHCKQQELIFHTDPTGKNYLLARDSVVIHLTDDEAALLR